MSHTGAKMLQVPEELNQQYDANHDFAIFGSGDPRQGGVQSLAEKMNIADHVAEDEERNDDSTNSKSGGGPSTKPSSADQTNSGSSEALPEDEEIEEL
jgi:hypothetical protein